MKTKLSTLLLLITLSLSAFAHDGHNHGAGQVQPTKGGTILKADKFYLEVVGNRTDVKIYPLKKNDPKSAMLTPIPLNQVKISATYALPRAKVTNIIALKQEADHFAGKVSVKNTHRYEVVVTIETLGEKEKLTYQIEPQE